MTVGCISIILDIPNYIYNSSERGNSINQNLGYREVGGFGKIQKISLFKQEIDKICRILNINPLQEYFAEDFLVSIKIYNGKGMILKQGIVYCLQIRKSLFIWIYGIILRER